MLSMQNVKDIEITEGDVRTIHDENNRLIWGRLAYDTKYNGDTLQNGTPTPDAPIPVQTVTGAQTVTVSDGVDSEDFTISLGSIELCKISTYQDYIYKSGNDWYVHKEVVKISPNGTEEWKTTGTPPSGQFYTYTSAFDSIVKTKFYTGLLSDNFVVWGGTPGWLTPSTVTDGAVFSNSDAGGTAALRIMFPTSIASTVTAVKTWLASNLPVFYYPIHTPTDTKITDTTLIGQLNAVHEWLTRYGYTSIVSGNLSIIINKANL